MDPSALRVRAAQAETQKGLDGRSRARELGAVALPPWLGVHRHGLEAARPGGRGLRSDAQRPSNQATRASASVCMAHAPRQPGVSVKGGRQAHEQLEGACAASRCPRFRVRGVSAAKGDGRCAGAHRDSTGDAEDWTLLALACDVLALVLLFTFGLLVALLPAATERASRRRQRQARGGRGARLAPCPQSSTVLQRSHQSTREGRALT